jgi:diguanylate cyclase (GGDEF)-like protein
MEALIADDDRLTTTMLARNLQQWDITPRVVHDGNAAWDIINGAAPPPLCLLDWMMPGVDGVELCRRIRNEPGLRQLYVLLLTARNSRSDMVTGLEAGADDYIVKPFDPDELRARVHVGQRVIGLQRQLSKQLEELEIARNELAQLASTDSLTGVATRRQWFQQAAAELARARRHGNLLSVLVIDIDHFKQVNDTYGHPTGDLVLARFGAVLRAECRQSDVVGRIGGEEFAMLAPNSSEADAATLGQRIIERFRSIEMESGGTTFRTTCSIGVAARESDQDTVEAMLSRADEALYRAKRTGRDRVEAGPGRPMAR